MTGQLKPYGLIYRWVLVINEQSFAAGPATNGLLLLVERKRQLLGDAHLLLEQLGREVHEALFGDAAARHRRRSRVSRQSRPVMDPG